MKRPPTSIFVSLTKKGQQGSDRNKGKRAPTSIFVSLTKEGQQGSGIRKNKLGLSWTKLSTAQVSIDLGFFSLRKICLVFWGG